MSKLRFLYGQQSMWDLDNKTDNVKQGRLGTWVRSMDLNGSLKYHFIVTLGKKFTKKTKGEE